MPPSRATAAQSRHSEIRGPRRTKTAAAPPASGIEIPRPPKALLVDSPLRIPPDPSLGPSGLRLSLPLPPSINAYYRSIVRPGKKQAQSIVSREGRAYRRQVAAVLQQRLPHGWSPLEGPLRIRIDLFMATRGSDPDNRAKACLDALQSAEGGKNTMAIFRNDKQICELHLIRWYDHESPRAEIRIWSENDPRRLDAWQSPVKMLPWLTNFIARLTEGGGLIPEILQRLRRPLVYADSSTTSPEG